MSILADFGSPQNLTLSSAIIVDYAKPVHALLLEAVPIIMTESIKKYPLQTPRQRVSAIIRATENVFYLCRYDSTLIRIGRFRNVNPSHVCQQSGNASITPSLRESRPIGR